MNTFNRIMSFSDRLYPHQVASVAMAFYNGYLDEFSGDYWSKVATFNPFITEMAKYMIENDLPWKGLTAWRKAVNETVQKCGGSIMAPYIAPNDSRDYREITITGNIGDPVTMLARDLVELAKDLIWYKQQMENL